MFMDVATDGFCNCKVSVLILAQFFLGGHRHRGRVLRTPHFAVRQKIQVGQKRVASHALKIRMASPPLSPPLPPFPSLSLPTKFFEHSKDLINPGFQDSTLCI